MDDAGSRIGFGTALFRLIGYHFGAAFSLMGFLWLALDEWKQGWHDRLARTHVVNTRQASPVGCRRVPPRSLRGRFSGHGYRRPRRRKRTVGLGEWGAFSDGLAPLGEEDEGLPYRRVVRLPGLHIQRTRQRGSNKRFVYTWPSHEALVSVMAQVRRLTRRGLHRTLADLLRRLNPELRGWCNYFRHGVSKRTFCYVDHFA